MTDLGKGVESEIAGVSDTVPKAVIDLKRGKKRLKTSEILENVPAPEPSFEPLSIPERQTQSLVANKILPIEFFNIFFTPEWLERFAEYTNKNAVKKRTFREEFGEQQEKIYQYKKTPQRP